MLHIIRYITNNYTDFNFRDNSDEAVCQIILIKKEQLLENDTYCLMEKMWPS